MAGLRPVVEVMYMDFISVCLDPIINQAAKLRYMTGGGVEMPVVFRMQTGGGRSAGAQHSQSLEAVLAHIPGLKVFCPADARDAYDLLREAIADPSPVCFIENRRLYPRRDEVAWAREPTPAGEPRVVRSGSELTAVTWGRMVAETVKAAESLSGPGSDPEIIDVRTLVPLKLGPVLDSVRRTGRCIVIHEATERFGPGGEVVVRIVDEALFELDGPVERYGAFPTPIPYSPTLEAEALPGRDGIALRLQALATG
jgi:pyruvate/2-oxoglutarate/acetoin dehydrogenase E1 component